MLYQLLPYGLQPAEDEVCGHDDRAGQIQVVGESGVWGDGQAGDHISLFTLACAKGQRQQMAMTTANMVKTRSRLAFSIEEQRTGAV